MFHLTPAAKNILIINGIIFILSDFIGLRTYIIESFGMRYFHSEYFQPYQILTYMWVHAGFGHLFSNMFSVLVFAPILEKVWGLFLKKQTPRLKKRFGVCFENKPQI